MRPAPHVALPTRRRFACNGVKAVHPGAINGHDHIHDAIDLVRARTSGQIDAEDSLLVARGIDKEDRQRQMPNSQTRVAAMLARALSLYEGRTIEDVSTHSRSPPSKLSQPCRSTSASKATYSTPSAPRCPSPRPQEARSCRPSSPQHLSALLGAC
jgi:hypothetical protein